MLRKWHDFLDFFTLFMLLITLAFFVTFFHSSGLVKEVCHVAFFVTASLAVVDLLLLSLRSPFGHSASNHSKEKDKNSNR